MHMPADAAVDSTGASAAALPHVLAAALCAGHDVGVVRNAGCSALDHLSSSSLRMPVRACSL